MDQREVVGHKDDRESEFFVKMDQQFDDFPLCGDVECGRDLITQEDFRVSHQRPCERHALALPAGQT